MGRTPLDLRSFTTVFYNIVHFRYSLSGIKPIPPPLISVDTSHSVSSSADAGSDYGPHGAPPASLPNNVGVFGGAGVFGLGNGSGGGGNGMPAVYGVPLPSAAAPHSLAAVPSAGPAVRSRPGSRYSNRSSRRRARSGGLHSSSSSTAGHYPAQYVNGGRIIH